MAEEEAAAEGRGAEVAEGGAVEEAEEGAAGEEVAEGAAEVPEAVLQAAALRAAIRVHARSLSALGPTPVDGPLRPHMG